MFRRKSGQTEEPQATGGSATPTSKRMFKVLKPSRLPPPSPVDEASLAMVMAQANCSREEGSTALRACPDVIDAIMWLSARAGAGEKAAGTGGGSGVEMLVACTGCPAKLAEDTLASCNGDVVEALLALNRAVLSAVESDEEQPEGDEEDEEDVLSFAANIHHQLKLHHRKSVNTTAMSRRDMIEQEIGASERVYFDGISILLKSYVLPTIERMSGDATIRSAFEEVSGPLTEVLLLHQELLGSLEGGKTVAEAFSTIASFEKCYGKYIEEVQSLLPLLEEWERTGPLAQVMKELRALCNTGDFRSHLIMPVQRIPRYQLFLRDLLKTIDSTSAEFALLRDRLQAVELVNRGINKRLADVANRKRMAGLAAQFVSDPGLSSQSGRMLEKEGMLLFKKNAKKWSKRKLFLFNDILAYASKSGNKFKLVGQYPLEQVRCQQLDDDQFLLRIKSSPPVELVFKADTMQEQLEWQLAVTNCLARRLAP